jgi:hypothetical protein
LAFSALLLTAAPAVARDIIPEAFRGVWNADGICRKGEPDDSKLTITARELRYYESGGSVISVAVRDTRKIAVKAKFGGEGETWIDTEEFRLSPNGDSLTAIFRNGTSFMRRRCKR